MRSGHLVRTLTTTTTSTTTTTTVATASSGSTGPEQRGDAESDPDLVVSDGVEPRGRNFTNDVAAPQDGIDGVPRSLMCLFSFPERRWMTLGVHDTRKPSQPSNTPRAIIGNPKEGKPPLAERVRCHNSDHVRDLHIQVPSRPALAALPGASKNLTGLPTLGPLWLTSLKSSMAQGPSDHSGSSLTRCRSRAP